jgi:DNA primase
LNTQVTYDQTKPFAHALARFLEREHPDLVVSDMKKALRVGKVLVDWSQNDEYKTTICVYSLRARERPTVSTPVTWEEVAQCFKKQDPNLLVFTSDQTLARADKMGDIFEPVLKLKQKLPELPDVGNSRRIGGSEEAFHAVLEQAGGTGTSAATARTGRASTAPAAAKKKIRGKKSKSA